MNQYLEPEEVFVNDRLASFLIAAAVMGLSGNRSGNNVDAD